MDAVRAGEPRVVAGEESLGRLVRWVHAIALPNDGSLLATYVSELVSVGVSALGVELGRKYTGGLPERFTAAAGEGGLPLIVFEREVPFVAITEAVHARIVDDQHDQLRAS